MLKLRHLLFLVCALNASGTVQAAQTPFPVLEYSENLSLWNISGGFFYLIDSCDDASSQTTAYIKRRALNYSFLSTLESVSGTPQCRTFRHAATEESGIY